jgi:hypothetical protein
VRRVRAARGRLPRGCGVGGCGPAGKSQAPVKVSGSAGDPFWRLRKENLLLSFFFIFFIFFYFIDYFYFLFFESFVWDLIPTQHHHNKCTTPPHTGVGPTHWAPPHVRGCCALVVVLL